MWTSSCVLTTAHTISNRFPPEGQSLNAPVWITRACVRTVGSAEGHPPVVVLQRRDLSLGLGLQLAAELGNKLLLVGVVGHGQQTLHQQQEAGVLTGRTQPGHMTAGPTREGRATGGGLTSSGETVSTSSASSSSLVSQRLLPRELHTGESELLAPSLQLTFYHHGN